MKKLTATDFARIRKALGAQAEADIEWAMNARPPASAREFALEVIFVICNSGMKHTVARQIFDRVVTELKLGKSAADAFGHAGKTAAMDKIWANRTSLYRGYLAAADKLAFAESLPFIGKVTRFHVAKNFGAQVAKPDVHLQRLADREGCTAQALCERLAKETGLPVSAVDTVLWRACATGVLDPRGPAGQRAPVAARKKDPKCRERRDFL